MVIYINIRVFNIVMAGYHFNPDKKKSGFAVDKSEAGEHWKSFSKNKLKVAIVLALLALVVVVGPDITGNIFYEDPEYSLLSENSDFPKLGVKEANLELYKCRDDVDDSRLRFDDCESSLSVAQELYSACSSEKVVVVGELQTANGNYNSCQAGADALKSSLDMCNSLKSSKETELGVCNSELSEIDSRLVGMRTERDKIIDNYANSVCCILKTLSNPSLKYYTVVNNRVVCSDTEGIEFGSCE